MRVDASIAEVVSGSPNAPLALAPDAVLIEAAVALAVARESLVVVRHRPPVIVDGYNVLSAILGSDDPWRTLYTARAADSARMPVYALPSDRLMDVVDRMRSAGRYNALVMEGDRVAGLLTTLDIARFLHSRGALKGVEPRGSAAVGVDPETPLRGILETMVGMGLRRLVLSGTGLTVSDRSLLRGLMDGGFLVKLRDDPRGALSDPVSLHAYMLERPGVLRAGADAHEALEALLMTSDHVLISEDGGTIVTPWDLAIRPLLDQGRSTQRRIPDPHRLPAAIPSDIRMRPATMTAMEEA
ncbi:MAG: CBS domain-containing protein [Conexivisphaera sp.]